MTDEMVIETSEDKRFRVRLAQDQDAQSPRRDSDCLLGHAVTVPHSDFEDVDEDGGPLADGWDRIKDRDDAMELFTRWARIFHGAVTETFTPYDGPKSVWYMLPEQIKEVGPGTTPLKYLQDEIEEYRGWRDDEVYGWIIEKNVEWVPKDGGDASMSTWEQVEDGSCWGYIGYDNAEDVAKDEFASFLASQNSKA